LNHELSVPLFHWLSRSSRTLALLLLLLLGRSRRTYAEGAADNGEGPKRRAVFKLPPGEQSKKEVELKAERVFLCWRDGSMLMVLRKTSGVHSL
jgi:hypothetical protein